MTVMSVSRSQPILFALASALAVMTAGGLMTDQGPWFQQLAQPPWRPPGWLFGPVWTLILALTALSFALAWQRAHDAGAQRALIAVFTINAALNILWNVLFFQMRRPDLAAIELVVLLSSIGAMMIVSGRHSQASAILLVPYALWVAFAATLNFEIVRLNGPFF